MNLKERYRRFRERFLEGPDWVDLPEFAISSYKSRTMLLVSWAYAYYIRWFTVPGRMIVVVSMMVFSYSLLLLDNPIRVLALALGAIFAVDFILGFIFRPRFFIEKRGPARARAGTPIKITYYLRNRRWLPTWNVVLDSLRVGSGLRFINPPPATNFIPANGEVHLETTVQTERRGKYQLQSPVAECAFPFGVFKWSCRQHSPAKLLIYPQFEPLTSLTLPVGRKYQKSGHSLVSKVGESMDFLGCREFRVGDDPKHIHWPSTARTGELIVKEYQEEYLTRIAVIVDTFIPAPNIWRQFWKQGKKTYPELESAVSLAGAIADFLSRGDYVIDIFAAGPDVYHFQGGRSLGHLDNILDILACIEANHGEPISELAPHIMQEVAGIGSAVLILLDWNEPRRALVRQLRDQGVAVKIIAISDREDFSSEDDVLRFASDDVAKGNARRL